LRLGLHGMPKHFSDPIAEDIIRDVESNLLVRLPLGRGKANHIVNALYARWSGAAFNNLSVPVEREADFAVRRAPYLFLFAGLRFSMNAAMPSERSSSAKVE
jgi:hypothetical protein